MNLKMFKNDIFARECIKPYKQIVIYAFGFIASVLLGITFYNVWWSGVVFIPFAIYLINTLKKEIVEKRRHKERRIFLDGLELMLLSLETGLSDENAYINAGERLFELNPKSITAQMWNSSKTRLLRNETLDDILYDLAKNTGMEEIREFRDIYMIARVSGGNLIEIIETIIDRSNDRAEVSREIHIVISGKRFEERIMCFMPFMMILYLRSSGDFINSLYGNLQGVIVMSVCAFIYMIAFMRAEKIVDIRL